MTTAIYLPDHSFPVHVPLYDIPNAENIRVFSVYGSTLAESLVNHSGRGAGVAVGTINVEDEGIRQSGVDDYVRYSDLGTLSTAGFTMIAAFRSPQVNLSSGLLNLWSVTDKNADTLRRRLFTDGSTNGDGPRRIHSYPSPPGDDTGRQLQADAPCLVSFSRYGNNVTGYLRLHNEDGSVISQYALANTSSVPYSNGTVLEVGNGSNASSGGSLIQGVGLWSGYMAPSLLNQAAASLAQATGLFD
ncbi:TPA: hypothetical protein ACNVV3_000350 [Pseudomonas putida]